MVNFMQKTLIKYVVCVAFGIFWVYGMITLMALFSLNCAPIELAAPLSGYVNAYTSVITFKPQLVGMLIILNNMLVLMVCLHWTFCPNIPVTGFLIGCLIKVKGGETASLLLVLSRLYSQPFAVLELGAYVLVISFSLYKRLCRRGTYDETYEDDESFLSSIVPMIGMCMLMVAGMLEAMLI